MELLLEDLSTHDRYKFLSAVVIPRPVALVTTKNRNGLCNAAPFSFFNVFSEDPAIAILGIGVKPNGKSKDTIQNIKDVKEFVINMVDASVIGAMHIASAEIPSDESEIDYAGVTLVDSKTISVQRIAEAPASLECELFQIIELTERRALVLGKIKAIYIKDEPRLAIAAELENGWTIINTHLSFVPGVNVFQLSKLKKWADSFGEKVLLMGDFNLPGSIPAMGSKWQSLFVQSTYPSWKPKIQFDYILSKGVALKDVIQVPTTKSGISDHLPLSVELN